MEWWARLNCLAIDCVLQNWAYELLSVMKQRSSRFFDVDVLYAVIINVVASRDLVNAMLDMIKKIKWCFHLFLQYNVIGWYL